MQLTQTEYDELKSARDNADKARKQAVTARDKIDALLAGAEIIDPAQPGDPAWETYGTVILRAGKPFIPHFINFSGLEDIFAPNGIWTNNTVESMLDVAKANGFNGLRITTNTVLHTAPEFRPLVNVGEYGQTTYPRTYCSGANSAWRELTVWGILDRLTAACAERGLAFIINQHRFCTDGPEPYAWGHGDSGYIGQAPNLPAEAWITLCAKIAGRYAGMPEFMGVELHNEPHNGARWMDDLAPGYMVSGECNWRNCVEDAVSMINEAAPDILILVTGTDGDWTSGESTDANANCGWGELFSAWRNPAYLPDFTMSDRIVIAPHHYGPLVGSKKPYAYDPSFPDNLPAVLEDHFGFLRAAGYQFPIMLTEYGGPLGSTGDADDAAHAEALRQYMLDRGIGGAFWAFANSADTLVLCPDLNTLDVDPRVVDYLAPLAARSAA